MAQLSAAAIKSIAIALANGITDDEVVAAVNAAGVATAQMSHTVAAVIVATNVSQTIDFASLKVADKVLVIAAAAGNAHFVTVATAATLGEAAVVGSLYVVLRAFTAPSGSTNTAIF